MFASPSLAHLVRETAKLVPHPTAADITLWDARNDRGELYGNLSDEAIIQIKTAMDTEISDNELSSIRPLGSGSDFTVFLQRIGVRLSDSSFVLESHLYSLRSPAQSLGLVQHCLMPCITTTRCLIRNAGWKYTETPVFPNTCVILRRNWYRFIQLSAFRSPLRNISVCRFCASLIHGSCLSTPPTTRSSSSRTWTSQPLFDSHRFCSLNVPSQGRKSC